MAFDTYGATSSSSSDRPAVDYDALNNYVVETAQLEEREVLVGYVSGIVDLGTQKLPDAENVFTGSEEDEAAEIEKNPDTYFKDGIDHETGKPARLKCYPQKDQQCVAVSVDFPDIMLDKGQFFGNSNPQPLRLWLGGQFFMQDSGMVIARPTPLKVTNLDKTRATKKWSFAQNHQLYKMALAAKLIKPGDCFLPKEIDKLLGQSMQFEVQVFFKENKGKKYFTEYIKLVGGLGRGQAACEVQGTPLMIQFNQENSPEALNELRWHVINTMKRASNWDTSKVKMQLESLGKFDEGKAQEQSDAPAEEPKKDKPKREKAPKKEEPAVSEEDESELPF